MKSVELKTNDVKDDTGIVQGSVRLVFPVLTASAVWGVGCSQPQVTLVSQHVGQFRVVAPVEVCEDQACGWQHVAHRLLLRRSLEDAVPLHQLLHLFLGQRTCGKNKA